MQHCSLVAGLDAHDRRRCESNLENIPLRIAGPRWLRSPDNTQHARRAACRVPGGLHLGVQPPTRVLSHRRRHSHPTSTHQGRWWIFRRESGAAMGAPLCGEHAGITSWPHRPSSGGRQSNPGHTEQCKHAPTQAVTRTFSLPQCTRAFSAIRAVSNEEAPGRKLLRLNVCRSLCCHAACPALRVTLLSQNNNCHQIVRISQT
jgi:hypothetical protein